MRRPHRDLALGLTFLLSIAVLARADDTTESREVVSKWAYYNNVAWGAFRKGDLELADYRFRKAIEVLRPHEKEHVRLMARSCHDLSRVLCAQGRYSEAEPFARWVVAARDAEGGQALLLEAHEGSRNSVRLHVACHVGFVALELVRQDLAAAARELPNAVMAGPASVVRRAAGLAPDAPTEAGLRETWQARGPRSG